MSFVPMHKFFSLNGELKSVKRFIHHENEGGIYEVLRVLDGIPLFLEEHLERFYYSAKLAGKNIGYSESQIKGFLTDLIEKNKVQKGNILISCKVNLVSYFVPHIYPADKMYAEGVECGILKAERDNPNAKVLHTTVRNRANQIISEKGFYEVLLVDHLGKMTEGSRSNLFFIEENEIITSPASKVLMGITRQKTLQLASALNISLVEREVSFSELQAFDAAFITGTSPKILPVVKIDAFKFNPQNKIVELLIKKYDEMIDGYVKNRKNADKIYSTL
jgi:branched-chain amino acid aminotransferase